MEVYDQHLYSYNNMTKYNLGNRKAKQEHRIEFSQLHVGVFWTTVDPSPLYTH